MNKIVVIFFLNDETSPDYAFGLSYKGFDFNEKGLELALAFQKVQQNKGYATDLLVSVVTSEDRIRQLITGKA